MNAVKRTPEGGLDAASRGRQGRGPARKGHPARFCATLGATFVAWLGIARALAPVRETFRNVLLIIPLHLLLLHVSLRGRRGRRFPIIAPFRTGFRTNRLHLQWLHVALGPAENRRR